MIAAIDIGGTKIAAGLVDEQGSVAARTESPTDAHLGYATARDRVFKMLRRSSQQAGVEISGIGIGATGPVDPFVGTFGDVNFLPGWEGENIVRDLEEEFRVSVAMENDADAAALGEASWGAGKDKSRLIYVTIGTGIGAALVTDGQLYRGVGQAHPEMGHHVIDPSGPQCLCGFRGCWESLAAGPAMVEWLSGQAPQDYPHRTELDAKRVCELALKGDRLAVLAVERETRYLGMGMANLVTMFAPDVIVLGGGVMKSASLFLHGIREIIRTSCRYVPFEKTEIALASLGDDANFVGAARVWYHRFAQEGKRAS
jgi:glucokinase